MRVVLTMVQIYKLIPNPSEFCKRKIHYTWEFEKKYRRIVCLDALRLA